mgnify:CR=1 FL=1
MATPMTRLTSTHWRIEAIAAPAAALYELIADYRNGHPRILPPEYFGPLEVLANTATNLQTGLASLDRTLDLLGEHEEFAETAARGTRRLAPG